MIYLYSKYCHEGLGGVRLWSLKQFSTLFQLYLDGQFYWWRKPEYPEKLTDLVAISSIRTHNLSYCYEIFTCMILHVL